MADIKFIAANYNPFQDAKKIERIVVINEPQRLIWLSCIIGGASASLAYNESISLNLKGKFNFSYFSEAFNEVVSRHEALRSTVTASGEHLVIYEEWPFSIPLIDISDSIDKQTSITSFISAEMNEVFDLQNGPLFRAFIHKLSDEHHYFTLVGHHMICDGWSFGIILENLSSLYNSKITDNKKVLKTAYQISEYASEMYNFKSSLLHEEVKNYWLSLYEDGIPVVDLPTDYPRPVNRNYKSHRFDHQVSLNLIERLKQLGAKNGSSLVNTLLSAFEIFISLKTGQKDVIIGIPTAGQAAAEMFELVGHCVNLLALRAEIESNLTFNQYLAERKAAFFDAYENQKFTFGELVETLDQKREQSRIPILPIIFNIDMGMDTLVSFENLQHELISNPRVYETFEIFLNATGSRSSFVLEWSYNTQLFRLETIKKLSEEFEQLLETLVNKSDGTISELFDNYKASWKRQLAEWNDTSTDYDKNKKLSELIDTAAIKFKDKSALSLNTESLTYNELFDYSERIASYLTGEGICSGDVIALASEYSLQMVASALGILKSGATVLLVDLSYPDIRIENMLSDSGARLLILSKSLDKRNIKFTEKIFLEDTWIGIQKSGTKIKSVKQPNDIAFIHYISSTFTKPIAIHIKHSSLISLFKSLQSKPGILSTDKLLVSADAYTDTKIVELFLPLTCGAEVVLNGFYIKNSDPGILDLATKNGITIISAIPSTLKLLTAGHNNTELPSAIKIWSFGTGLNKDLADKLLSNFGGLWNIYGLPETGIISAVKQVNHFDEGINIGSPVNNTRVYIADEHDEIILNGKAGQILIGGIGISDIYAGKDKILLKNFVKDTFSSNPFPEFLYKTGDIGRFSDNGDLQYLGRTGNQVNIDGQRVDFTEVEEILNMQNDIESAIVFARENRDGNINLTAYVVLDVKTDVDETALTESWKRLIEMQLPRIMHPSNFIILEKLPLKANYQIDKNALPKVKTFSNKLLVPEIQTNTEKIILEIWSDILGIADIDKDDDFFEIGGNSMLAVKMMAEIEKKIGKRFPLATLITSSTIRKLAVRLQASDEVEEWESLVPIRTQGIKTPLYLIHGAGLNILLFKSIAKFFDEDQPIYGIQAFGLNDEKDIPDTVEKIAQKHITEILQANPTGPYAIAGYSLGGYIAFEIVKQLLESGREVSFLGIIDTYAINKKSSEGTKIKLFKKIQRQFYKIPFFVKSFFNNPKEAAAYQLYILQNKIKSRLAPDAVVRQNVATTRESEIYKVYANAYENYDLQPLPIKIDLFRVQKRLYYLDDLTFLGWDKLTNKGVEVNVVPGDHKTFLEPPNDKNFTEIIQLVLNKIEP